MLRTRHRRESERTSAVHPSAQGTTGEVEYTIHQGRNNMDDLKKSQESMGGAAAGVKRQISETAADVKEKLTEIGGTAAGQLSEVAQSATDKVKAAADYLRQTELKAMTEDVKDIVKRYPGWTLAAAAVVGFLLAHLRSRD
jgi:ElaB/YqjD/DUF883 family membrane-anchored ribosome-binding protein